MTSELLASEVEDHIQAVSGFFLNHANDLDALAERLAAGFERGSPLLVCGNGGSACDALHIAGEFVGRFVDDRRPLPALALSADTGMLTAIGNDYGFDEVFSRQVEAYGKKGDVLIALSTSGSSPNILKAIATAKKKGLFTVLLTGEKGKENLSGAEMLMVVSSLVTARIQEVHIMALHSLAALVEEKMGL